VNYIGESKGRPRVRETPATESSPNFRPDIREINAADLRQTVDGPDKPALSEFFGDRREGQFIDDLQPALFQTVGKCDLAFLLVHVPCQAVAWACGARGQTGWWVRYPEMDNVEESRLWRRDP
jgi:hypothetical protein